MRYVATIKAIAITMALTFMALPARSQGHQWIPSTICEPCIPTDFMYGDSSNLVIVTRINNQRGMISRSSDAGKSWELLPDRAPISFHNSFEFYSFFQPSTFFHHGTSTIVVTTDLGSTWEIRGSLANTTGGKMFTTQRGVWMHFIADTVVPRKTDDGGWSFLDRGVEWSPSTTRIFFEDSNKYWRIHNKVIYRTRDAGHSWEAQLPTDSADRDIVYYYLHKTSDSSRFYLVGGPRNEGEYFVTSDGGRSWRDMAPITHGRIAMIAEQSEDRVWLLVGRNTMHPVHNLYQNTSPTKFADTLYYTTDAGLTWQKDLTFVGDTISELQFHGPNHGYVVSTRDSTVRVWRFVPGTNAVSSSNGYDGRSLHIHPNPVGERLRFFTRLSGRCSIRILDALGLIVEHRDSELRPMEYQSLPIPDHLPNGLYFLELVRGDARAGQRFILQR